MSNDVIAVVCLQPGQGGYYDDLSRIHLTVGNPQANVYAGTNCSQLRRNVQAGRLKLISGSFGPEVQPFKLVRDGNRFLLAHNDNKINTFPKDEEIIKAEKNENFSAEAKVTKDSEYAEKAKAEEIEKDEKAEVTEKITEEVKPVKKPAKKAGKKPAAKKDTE